MLTKTSSFQFILALRCNFSPQNEDQRHKNDQQKLPFLLSSFTFNIDFILLNSISNEDRCITHPTESDLLSLYQKTILTLLSIIKQQAVQITQYLFLMGQCNLNEIESNYFGDLFKSQTSDQMSFFSKDSTCERDRVIWEHELNISHLAQIPQRSFWKETIDLVHPCFSQIGKDVTRTFPESNFFGNKANLDKLQKILKKFALYFPKLGYTQGINFLAGFLLLSGCEQEETFNILIKMMIHDRIMAIGLYEDGFPLNKFYCELFWLLLEKKMPSIYEKLRNINIPDQIWIFQWFITLFLYNFPIQIVKSFWDFSLSKKQFAPVLIALGILKTLKYEIMQLQIHDQIDFYQFTEQFRNLQFCKQCLDLKKIFAYANSITKSQIDRAISFTKCTANPYRIYFASSLISQRQQWQALFKNMERERSAFRSNPQAKKYERQVEIDVIEHLQKLVLSKYKLYQSQLKKSNGSFYKKSNLSIPFSNRTSPRNPLTWNLKKKNI